MSDTPAQHEQETLNGPTVTEGGEGEGSQVTATAAAAPAVPAEGDKLIGELSETGSAGGSERISTDVQESTDAQEGEVQVGASKFQPNPAQDDATVIEETPEDSNEGPQAEKHDSVQEKNEDGTTIPLTTEESHGLADAAAAAPSPSLSHVSLRPPSPSSRTSTPPLTGTIAPTAKKFSAINVNKKFLSKTGSTPSPSNASAGNKLNLLSSRPATSPVPIAAPSSRLLSTKLTTVSSSKPSVSPQPPSSASTSAPWAKSSLTQSDGTMGSATSSLQPLSANGRARMPLNQYSNSGAPMGQGQGLGSARPAWRAVNADGKRPPAGMSREFPTAREVAEGKRAAESAAQAQAAQAAAILQNLEEEFTHLKESAHRWDDDEDEDGIIDFGGDLPVHHSVPPRQNAPAPPRPEPPLDQPVAKSDRFVEDFDRSWPRSARQAAEEMQRPPDLRKRESDRVLFNASSNRLETPSSRPQPPPQPTRLMSRTEPSHPAAPSQPSATGARDLHRQAPPHLTNQTGPPGRQLPPHMMDAAPSRPAPSSSQPPARSAWANPPRDAERPLPPHMASKPETAPQPSALEASRSPPTGPGSALPPRRSFGQATQPPMHHPSAPTHAGAAASTVDPTDSQAAEMHSAAEKARLRREAEEEERKATAERAKQKARELEARLGLKSAARSTAPVAEHPTPPAPPTLTTTPSYTIAQRPKAVAELAPVAEGSHEPAVVQSARSTVRPAAQPVRSRDDLWRTRDAPPHQEPVVSAMPASEVVSQPRSIAVRNKSARPTAESFFETEALTQPSSIISEQVVAAGSSTRQPTDAEVQALFVDAVGEQPPKKDYMFDDTLARIKAAMGGSKASQAAPADRHVAAQDTRTLTSDILPQKPAPREVKTAPVPLRQPIVPEFFNVTQPEIPRSPPPAWRTYTVKVPKQTKPKPAIPESQLSTLKRMRLPARGWLMSFNPPLDLPPHSLSSTDIFLPAPGARRVTRTDSTPLVSISQIGLEPYAKDDNHRASHKPNRQSEPARSTSSQTRSSGRWRTTEEAPLPSVPEPVATQVAVDLLDAPPVLPKASARPAPPPQPPLGVGAGTAKRFEAGTDAVKNGSSAPAKAAAESKAGVRFMAASEHEGDSLLDEVNKMSLESVEEAGMKDRPLGAGAEILPPRSPVSHGAPSAPRTHPSSPNGNVTWNTSHEHLKHVWQQTPQQNVELQSISAPTSNPEISTTPLYPSLNAPSTSDPPASQSAATKLSYSSQTFSPTSATFSSLRQQSPGVGYSSSPTSADGMSGLGYPRGQAAVNGYSGMNQQNLWSAPFSTPSTAYGAGYASSKAAMDPKTAMTFNAGGNVGAGSQYLYGQTGGYTSLPTAHSPYGQFASHQTQAQQQQQHPSSRMSSSPNGTYNYPSGYTQANRMSRFGQPNGAGATAVGGVAEYDNGGYYGYVGAGGGQTAQPNQSHGMYYTSSGSAAVGHGAMHQRGAQGGQGRKMW